MTEKSWYWPGIVTGDAGDAPYDDDEFSDIWRKLFQRDRTLQGIIEGYENELAVTNPAGNTIRVATGAALVDGKFYETDANVDNVIATPGALTRIDRVVLRKDFAAQTVRVVILTGIEGGVVPALTQNDGVTWEIPLAQVSITVAPVITITDERNNARTPLAPAAVPAMQRIESIVGDGVITTFDFQNIPADFTSLLIVGTGRILTAVLEADLQLRFNNDAGANYHRQRLLGSNAVAAANAVVSQTEIDVGFITGANGVANHVSQFEILIANYVQATFFKTAFSSIAHIPSATAADFDAGHFAGVWENIAAINRITLLNSSAGAIIAGTEATLYGLL